MAAPCFEENLGNGAFCRILRWAGVQAMIGEPATQRMKVGVPIFESIQKLRETSDLAVTGGFHSAQPLVPAFGQMNLERAVGPECGIDGHGKTGAGDALVMTKVVDRVVGGAERGHTKAPQNPARR